MQALGWTPSADLLSLALPLLLSCPMSRLFLSYSRADAVVAIRLHDMLDAAGHDVWMDKSDIKSGAQWRKSIVEAIESAERVLVLLSENSVESDNVRREIDIALDGAVSILPLTLDEVPIPTALRYQLAGIQRHDLFNDFDQGIQALLELLARGKADAGPAHSTSHLRPRAPATGKWIGPSAVCAAAVVTAIALYASTINSAEPAEDTAATFASSPLAVYLFLCAGIYAGFQMTESLLRRPVLREIGDWLMGDSLDGQRAGWSQGFITMFDYVFHVRRRWKRLKIPGFLRSCVVSLGFALLLYGIFTFAGLELLAHKLSVSETFLGALAPDSKWVVTINAVLFTILLAALFNVLPDYVSLIESRYILERLEFASGAGAVFALLAIDAVFTVGIAFVGSAIANVLSPLTSFVMTGNLKELKQWDIPFGLRDLLQVYGVVFGFHPYTSSEVLKPYVTNYCAVFIYSTFLTSGWIWLYLGAGLIVKAGTGFERLRRVMLGPFRVKDRPLSVLGWLCIVVVSAGFWSIQWIGA